MSKFVGNVKIENISLSSGYFLLSGDINSRSMSTLLKPLENEETNFRLTTVSHNRILTGVFENLKFKLLNFSGGVSPIKLSRNCLLKEQRISAKPQSVDKDLLNHPNWRFSAISRLCSYTWQQVQLLLVKNL